MRSLFHRDRISIVVLISLVISGVNGCAYQSAPATTTEIPVTDTVTPSPVLAPTPIPTETPPPLVDYGPIEAELETYLTDRVYDWGFDLGIAFVDIQTGQVIAFRGDRRYHAMSSFKGPLAVRYYQMLESGETSALADDARNLDLMLRVSYNQSTTCFFDHIGGVPAFNDWLAESGFERENNFVFRWDEWPCPQPPIVETELIDYRYLRGDEELGLPGDGQLLRCIEPQLPCDKAFTPIELAQFYARLYEGDFISQAHRDELLSVMERQREESVFWVDVPEGTAMHVYTKGGTHEATEVYRVNFFSEAGIIVTDHGAFAVAMFMQRQPEWPGTFPMARAFSMFLSYFESVYAGE